MNILTGIGEFIDSVWFPLLFGIVCMVMGILSIKTKKVKYLRSSKSPEKYKDEERFAVEAGKLIVILGICAFAFAGILLFSAKIAAGFGVAAFAAYVIAWKKMNDKYGPN